MRQVMIDEWQALTFVNSIRSSIEIATSVVGEGEKHD